MVRSLLYLVLLLSCACAPAPAGRAPTPSDATRPVPIPSNWTLVKYLVDGKEYSPYDSSATLTLREGQIGGHTGCNTFGTAYERTKDNTFQLEGAMATQRYCEKFNQQENAILDAFRETITMEVTDDRFLIVRAGQQRLKYLRDQ